MPVKLPADPEIAKPFLRQINNVPNRTKHVLDLLTAHTNTDKIKSPGDSFIVRIPDNISKDALFWLNAYAGENLEHLWEVIGNQANSEGFTKQERVVQREAIVLPPRQTHNEVLTRELPVLPVKREVDQRVDDGTNGQTQKRGRDRDSAM